MNRFESTIAPNSTVFTAARDHMLGQLSRLRKLEQRTRDASAAAAARFERRGQLLPRDRLALLLDAGAPFLEFSTLAGFRLDTPDADKSVPGGGVITGIGCVAGTRCVVAVNDSGIDAGALQPRGLDKQLRAQEIALENKLPYVQLVAKARSKKSTGITGRISTIGLKIAKASGNLANKTSVMKKSMVIKLKF